MNTNRLDRQDRSATITDKSGYWMGRSLGFWVNIARQNNSDLRALAAATRVSGCAQARAAVAKAAATLFSHGHVAAWLAVRDGAAYAVINGTLFGWMRSGSGWEFAPLRVCRGR